MMAYSEFRKLAAKANVVPVFDRVPADLDTPVSAYIKLAARHQDTFLLESVEGGEKLARYSFVGCDPFVTVEATGREITLCQGKARRKIETDPLDFMKELFSFYRPVRVEGLPRFTGGAVGYFAYDTVRLVEDVPDANPDNIGLPDMRFGMYRHLVVFDHLRQEIVVIANVLHEIGERGLKKKYDEARAYIQNTIARLQKPVRLPRESESGHSRMVSHSSQKEYAKIVQRARRYIREGDIFQVVLSQRWHVDSKRSALSVYRRLRRINPSPYMFLIRHGGQAVIGASPEMMVRVENGRIETRPIAGTRPRGRNEEEDERRIKSLMADPKELAEHTMLLDLGRNDIGRVARTGTVKVQDQMIVEKYSHVIHLVSSVSGAMSKGTSPIDGHFACFPAGTVSGAPKIRAMEIIDELETERRGVYAGSIAYIDFWGNLDSCIAIRTIVKDGRRYYVQAGAGIVADSKPVREFKETEAKARALVEAITGTD